MQPKDWKKIEKLLENTADQETLDAVKALLDAGITVTAVKKVQRGRTGFSSRMKNVTIEAVNLEKSFVNISGCYTYKDEYCYGAAVDARLTSETNLRIYGNIENSSYFMNWEVIEFY